MYALKPIVSLPEQIPLPTVMYALPKIQGDGGEGSGSGSSSGLSGSVAAGDSSLVFRIGRQTPLPEINLLEARQTRILDEIFELKSYFTELYTAVILGSNGSNLDLEPLKLNNPKAPVHAEIIINANPTKPPYFILALQRIWTDSKFNVKIHTSCCYNEAVKNLFEEKLLKNVNNDATYNIDVTLIWKNVKDVQLITKVYDFPFEGEANILRYLVRLTEKCDYEKQLPKSNSIDSILDLCLRLPYEESRFKNAIVAKFSSYLNKNPWLLDSIEPSIVDVAVWSVFKHEANNKIPRELKTWFDLCEKTFLSD